LQSSYKESENQQPQGENSSSSKNKSGFNAVRWTPKDDYELVKVIVTVRRDNIMLMDKWKRIVTVFNERNPYTPRTDSSLMSRFKKVCGLLTKFKSCC
jgi:hypothetical protein